MVNTTIFTRAELSITKEHEEELNLRGEGYSNDCYFDLFNDIKYSPLLTQRITELLGTPNWHNVLVDWSW